MQTEELSILLVEDEKKIADVLKKGLTEQQFHVEVAYDGLIGKKLFETYPFNLIILDLNLPALMV
jgi:DNA-binding response OmpR family regulator